MGRLGGVVALAGVVLFAACSGGASESRSTPTGDAITVNGTTISAAELVAELAIIAGNEALDDALDDDDIVLVPRAGTISPTLSSTWVTQRVNQLLIDQEFERRSLTITPELQREAEANAATLFRGPKVFNQFPKAFRDLVIERQVRIEALEAEFPATGEATEAELVELLDETRALCEGDKLVAQIVVETKAEADAVAAELGAGADFATLAEARSLDGTSAPNGGVFTCVGSTRYAASEPAVRDAVERLPIGATSPPLESQDSYTIVRILPFTLETARPLLLDAWDAEHLSPFGDFVRELLDAADLEIKDRFAALLDAGETVGIFPPERPVQL